MSDFPSNIDGRLGHAVVVVDGAGNQIEARLVGYAPQPSAILELPSGETVAYPVEMVQPRPLRELVAELIDEAHGPWVTEGGCGFEAYRRPSRPGFEGTYHDVVGALIALVRNHPGPHEGDVGTCAVCAMYGDYTEGRWVHCAPDAPIARGHEFVVA